MKVRIGTRGSKLALIQAKIVKFSLEKLKRVEVELKIIKTKGDKILDSPLARIADKGLFVKEIEISLLEGKIDIGVHSLKDIPTEQPEGLQISAFLEREAANDVFVSTKYATLRELKPGSTVGTSSLRRKSQLLHLRPDLIIKDIRGNMYTRLKKLDQGEYEALILASAGLRRLGFEERITELFPLEVMVPAVGQGIIALETRVDDEEIISLCRLLHHQETEKAVVEERDFLKVMGGGCQVPLGCFAWFEGENFWITGFIGDLEGKKRYQQSLKRKRGNSRGSGKYLAELLLDEGGQQILEEIRE